MSEIIFTYEPLAELPAERKPEAGQMLIGYDSDGTLKQMDGAGNITLIAGGFSGYSGTSGTSGYSGHAGAVTNEIMGIALSNEVSQVAFSTGTPKFTYYSPVAFTINEVYACLTAASSDTATVFDIHKNGTTIFSTKPVIDATEYTTATAAASVITGGSVSANDKLEFFIDSCDVEIRGAKIILK